MKRLFRVRNPYFGPDIQLLDGVFLHNYGFGFRRWRLWACKSLTAFNIQAGPYLFYRVDKKVRA